MIRIRFSSASGYPWTHDGRPPAQLPPGAGL